MSGKRTWTNRIEICEAEATGERVSVRLTDASAKALSQKLYSRPVVRRGAAV